jgi:hypothetical protein
LHKLNDQRGDRSASKVATRQRIANLECILHADLVDPAWHAMSAGMSSCCTPMPSA